MCLCVHVWVTTITSSTNIRFLSSTVLPSICLGTIARIYPHFSQFRLESRRKRERAHESKLTSKLEKEGDEAEFDAESAEHSRENRYQKHLDVNATGRRAHSELYDILGISKTATLPEIQSKFRALSLQW